MKGIWTEVVLVGAPEFLGAESGFAKIKLTHRQYFTIVPDDLSLVYRLAYQTTIGGHVPFYYQSQVITSVMKGASSEGLGGAKSLRGIRRNRVVGDGFFYGNIEARWKAVRFKFINNNFYLGLNGFMDFGQVTKKIDANFAKSTSDNPDDYFAIGTEKMHFSYGAGMRIVMNTNFIIAIDYGFAADERDGDSGLYIGLNYLF
jgi:hemolysin activation/secretion protein